MRPAKTATRAPDRLGPATRSRRADPAPDRGYTPRAARIQPWKVAVRSAIAARSPPRIMSPG